MTPSLATDTPPPSHRLRFELIVGSVLLAVGLFVLPGLVFWVGGALLGPYGKDVGIGTFYGNFYGDLASGVGRTWALAVGPLILVTLLRLLFLRRRAEPASADAASPKPDHRPANDVRRVEPRVSLD